MYRNTVSTHQDFENLEEALTSMKELAEYINENKNDADEINKILSIQNRLINWPAVLFILTCELGSILSGSTISSTPPSVDS